MRKILFVIFAVLATVPSYLFYSVEIFSPVHIQFQQTENFTYHPMKTDSGLTCFQTEENINSIQQDKFRLLIWNVHKGLDHGWQEELENLAQGKDFLLLQEATNTQNLAEKFSSQFPTALYATAFAYLTQQSGVQILSKFSPHFYCAGAEVEPWIRIPKVGEAMTFPLANGQALLVVNVHLINFEINLAAYRQQLSRLMSLVNRHHGPIVLAGDFNSWNGYRLALIRELAKQYDLQEVNFSQDHRLRFLDYPLDHVFLRGLSVTSATTRPTEASDHAPLLVEVDVLH